MGAIKRTSIPLPQSLDRHAASAALIPFPLKNLQVILIISRFSIRIHEIGKTGSIVPDSGCKHLPDRANQMCGLLRT
jgi:hypothetical protein